MDEISLDSYFLKILNNNPQLEKEIIDYLSINKNKYINKKNFLTLPGKKIRRELRIELESILFNLKILKYNRDFIYVDEKKLNQFIKMINIIKAINKNNIVTKEDSSIIYMSPPKLITNEISDVVDGTSNLIRSLVCSVSKSLMIMSSYINYEGLKSILLSLKNVKKNIKLECFFTPENENLNSFLNNLFDLLPESLIKNTDIYVYNTDNKNNVILPHAKILIIDEESGYLGSANFTFQVLKDNFELGINLNIKQCKTIMKIKSVLISNKIFIKYRAINV